MLSQTLHRKNVGGYDASEVLDHVFLFVPILITKQTLRERENIHNKVYSTQKKLKLGILPKAAFKWTTFAFDSFLFLLLSDSIQHKL